MCDFLENVLLFNIVRQVGRFLFPNENRMYHTCHVISISENRAPLADHKTGWYPVLD